MHTPVCVSGPAVELVKKNHVPGAYMQTLHILPGENGSAAVGFLVMYEGEVPQSIHQLSSSGVIESNNYV